MKKYILTLLAVLVMAFPLMGEDYTKPTERFTDYAGIVDKPTTDALNAKLKAFHEATSNEFVIVVYPQLKGDLRETTIQLARDWKIGSGEKNNALAFFVFLKDTNGKGAMRLEVGDGLEGALPDGKVTRLLTNEIRPLFKNKKWSTGFNHLIASVERYTKGEYTNDGSVTETYNNIVMWFVIIVIAIILLIVIVSIISSRKGGGGRYGSSSFYGGDYGGYSGRNSSGSSSSGGYSSSGGGSSFSGGGGSSDF